MTPRGQCAELERILDENPLLGDRAAIMARIDALTGVEECIRDGLLRARATGDWGRFERYVLAATRHPTRLATPVLCEVLLLRSDEVNNEDIVETLELIADPAAVDCLTRTLLWQPEWDEFHQLAVKCVWALGAIGTPDAVRTLRDVASVGPEEVREAAGRQLAKLGQGG